MIKRIIIEVDILALPFEQMEVLSASLAALERLSNAGHIHMTSGEVGGYGKLKRVRSDKLDLSQRSIHPQEATIIAHLRENGPSTVSDISTKLGIGNNSTRGNLHSLLKKGLTCKSNTRPTLWRVADS